VIDALKETLLIFKFTTIMIILSGTLILPVSGESINLTVNPGAQEMVPINDLKVGYSVTGSLTVSGGGNEIRFWVIDPDGNQVLNLGTVVQGKSFEFTTQKNGAYYLRFDNRESTALKNVIITYDVQMSNTSSNPYIWEGIILIITLFAFLVLIYWRRRARIATDGSSSRGLTTNHMKKTSFIFQGSL